MILNTPRPCVNGCGATVEWAFDRRRRVGLIESASREAHICPRRLTGAYIACACGAPIHTYADGAVEDARTKLPHECRPGETTGARAAPSSEGTAGATRATRAPSVTTPPAPEPPRRSLNDALGVE